MPSDIFRLHQRLLIPELAEAERLASQEFVVEEILRGGMGICAKIRSASSRSPYALKVIASHLIPDHGSWIRWQREMRVWLQLSAHAGVVPAYSVCWVNEVPCIATGWMDGGNLRSRLVDRDPELFYRTAIRVARTLEWVYQRHAVVHRDLKPENLLLDGDGNVLISDWGIARLSDAEGDPAGPRTGGPPDGRGLALTQPGRFLGTVAYASPEQLLGRTDIDHRADMYSLGCLLFEWETGRCPFTGRTVIEVAEGHLRSAPPRLGGLLRKTAFGAEPVIHRCLQKAPGDRFADYSELIDALREAATKRGVQIKEDSLGVVYELPVIGSESVRRALGPGPDAIPLLRARDGQHAIAEQSDLEPFIREAAVLLGLRDWAKAEQILSRLYVPEVPLELEYAASVAVNYALCLIRQGRAEDAVPILSRFAAVREKPAAYFVNHSLALLHLGDARQAASVATEGLAAFHEDPDLLGNLTIALRGLNRLPEAVDTARRRLAVARDTHALEEAASVLRAIAEEVGERDLPAAAAYLTEAEALLREAKASNPRFLTARVSLVDLLVDLEKPSEALEEVAEILGFGVGRELGLIAARVAARAMALAAAHRECVEHCDRFLKEFPGDLELQRTRARAIVDGFCIGKERDGVRVVERTSLEFFESTAADPSIRVTEDLLYLGRLREWMGDVPTAKRLISHARDERPDWWKPPFVLAGLEWREGNTGASKSLLALAAEMAPWQTQPWHLLARVLTSAGHVGEAAAAGSRAEQIARHRSALLAGPTASRRT